MKRCSKCNAVKEVGGFSPNKKAADRLQSWCKECCLEHGRKIYAQNIEKERERSRKKQRAIYQSNPDAVRIASKAWKKRNADYVRQYSRQEYKSKRHYYIERSRQRKDLEVIRTPSWADKEQIAMWYEVSEVLSRSGVKFHVDHIVPLKGKDVCGLHTHDNLQVMPWWQNLSKGIQLCRMQI